MIIGLKSQLASIKEDLKNNVSPEALPIKGTLAVINSVIRFNNIDGYIKFMKLTLDNIPNAYGRQNEKWQECINSLYAAAEKLQSINTKFNGNTKEEFQAYCKNVSRIMDKDVKRHLDTVGLDIIKDDNMVPFMEKYVAAGSVLAFYYEDMEDVKKELMDELMNQLSNLKFEKSGRQYDISRFLMDSGYHEHIHDALNILIQTSVYAINCCSTEEQEAYDFDIEKINNNLRYVKATIERIKDLV